MPSRRQFNTLLAGASMSAAVSRRAGATSKPGGDLTIAYDGGNIPFFLLDAHNCRIAPQSRILRSIYDNLVVLRDDQSVAPWLATSWEISPDRRQYTFNLRPDVVFHDGTEFDAAAVKANFDRILDPANTLASVANIGPYSGATVLSDYQVRLDFSAPFEPFLHNLSATNLAMVSPAAAAKYGKLFSQNPVGTGPFKFVGLVPGQKIRLAKNPDYQWAPANATHAGPAYLDTLTFISVPEQLTRVAALQSGQVQGADLIPSQNIAQFKTDPDFQFLQKELLGTNYALALNVDEAPWDDLDVRNAARLSLNIDEIVRVVYLGTIERAWSPLSSNLFGAAEQHLRGSWKPDPAQARAILDAKGWVPGSDGIRVKNGQRLAISFIDANGNREQRLDVVHLVRRQLHETGIDLSVDSEAFGAFFTKIAHDEYSSIGVSQYAPDPDVLRYSFVPQFRAPYDGTRANDPQLNQWLIAAAAESDPVQRAKLYVQAQTRIVDQVYEIPIYIERYNVAVAASMQGVTLDAHGFPVYQAASIAST
jgi:peptide/nickel transport system substrate-binding protein